MMNDILFKLFPNYKDLNIDFKKFIQNKYSDFITYSEIPKNCYNFYDKNIIFPKLNNLYENFYTAVSDRYSILLRLKNYNFGSYLSYMFMNKYFKECIVNNYYLENILYIDTRLLMEDYKRLMDKTQVLIHQPCTLLQNIEQSALVIWDKLSLINSNYDRNKLLDIINIRQRKNLSNIYLLRFTDHDPEILGNDLYMTIMNEISLGLKCETYNYNINNFEEDTK